MLTYPLTLKINHRPAQPRIIITDAQAQTVLEGQAVMSMFKSAVKQLELTAGQRRSHCRYRMTPQTRFSVVNAVELWDEHDRQAIGMIQSPKLGKSRYQINDRQQRPMFSIATRHPRQDWAEWGFLALFALGFLCAVLPSTRVLAYCLFGGSLLGLYLIRSAYLLNMPHAVERSNGQRIMEFLKKPSLGDDRTCFTIQATDAVSESEAFAILFGIIWIAFTIHGPRNSD
jgi:hypothetical protein